jgi:hypothetical protein
MSFALPNQIEGSFQTSISRLLKIWIPKKTSSISLDYWMNEVQSLSSKKSINFASLQLSTSLMRRVQLSNTEAWRKLSRRTASTQHVNSSLHQYYTGSKILVKNKILDNTSAVAGIPADVITQLRSELSRVKNNHEFYVRSRFPVILNYKITQIAKTQANSSNTTLTRALSESVNIPAFIWKVTPDTVTRYSHLKLSDVVVFWKDLPSPELLVGEKSYLGAYSPGNCPNCRCHPEPILSLDQIFSTNRALVYFNGLIHSLTKAEFIKLSGIQ